MVISKKQETALALFLGLIVVLALMIWIIPDAVSHIGEAEQKKCSQDCSNQGYEGGIFSLGGAFPQGCYCSCIGSGCQGKETTEKIW